MHEWRRKFSRSTIIDNRSERKESEKGGVIQLFDETWFVQTNISRAVIYLEAIARLITFRLPVVRSVWLYRLYQCTASWFIGRKNRRWIVNGDRLE